MATTSRMRLTADIDRARGGEVHEANDEFVFHVNWSSREGTRSAAEIKVSWPEGWEQPCIDIDRVDGVTRKKQLGLGPKPGGFWSRFKKLLSRRSPGAQPGTETLPQSPELGCSEPGLPDRSPPYRERERAGVPRLTVAVDIDSLKNANVYEGHDEIVLHIDMASEAEPKPVAEIEVAWPDDADRPAITLDRAEGINTMTCLGQIPHPAAAWPWLKRVIEHES